MRSGDRVGHLVIERELGAGGMGEVFLAYDERLQRQVAVKLLPVERALDRGARQRMLREARSASALKHPGIVTVYDVGEHDGRAFIAMEFVEGETFDKFLDRRGKLPPGEAVELLAAFGDAVAAAHEAGVLHRDLKPANLMIDTRGRVKVLDFGLSKRTGNTLSTSGVRPGAASAAQTDDVRTEDDGPPTQGGLAHDATAAPEAAPGSAPAPAPSARDAVAHDVTTPAPSRPSGAGTDATLGGDAVTAYGVRMGTPGYAALELLDGEDADLRSDVFSLGVVLYRMLTGELPFPQRTWGDLRTAMVEATYPPARTYAPAAAPLEGVIARALAGDRQKRFESVTALVEAARAAAAAASEKPTKTRSAPLLGAVAAVGGIAIVGWWWTSGRERDGDRRTVVSDEIVSPDAAASAAARTPPRADRARQTQLTRTGGCAYSPTFVDERTIVYDLTKDGANDLYRIDRDGGAPVQLTTASTSEWRAAPGARPGELVFVSSDWVGDDSHIAAIDLANPTQARRIATLTTSSVVAAGAGYYFPDTNAREIRRVVDGRDERFIALTAGQAPDALIADRQGKRLAFITRSDSGVPALCIVDIAAVSVACTKTEVDVARPAFSPDGNAIYATGRRTIVRHDLLTGTDDVTASDVLPLGGIAVSPSGDRIVYSECHTQSPLFEVTSGEPRAVTKYRTTDTPTAGPGGVLAFVVPTGHGDSIFLLGADGSQREVVTNDPARISNLAFSADGNRLAYARRHPDGTASGIYEVVVNQPGMPRQITDGAFDEAPVFLDDQTLLFNRPDADQTPRAFTIGRDGTDLRRVPGAARVPVAIDRGRNRVLGWSSDRATLVWWDPRTGATTRGPRPAIDVGMVSLSPDASWIAFLTREDGGEILRAPIAEADKPKRVAKFPLGVSTRFVTVGDDGRVFVDAGIWLGELFTLPAADRAF